MRFEIKVKPEYVAFLKQSFDECRAKVLEQEPGCLDYSLFQSYNDSTLFCLTDAWQQKARIMHTCNWNIQKNTFPKPGESAPSLQTKWK
jgi:quinol monooxygenase YgiN